MLVLQLAISLCLAFIGYQDFRYRAVYWWCFPILAVLIFFLKYNTIGAQVVFTDAGYGLLFLVVQLFLLWVYFSVKNKGMINITNSFLGLGDILFLIAIAFYLSPANYIIFYMASLVMVLLFVLLLRSVSKNTDKHIPLAGLQAILLGLVLWADQFFSGFHLYTDNWIYSLAY